MFLVTIYGMTQLKHYLKVYAGVTNVTVDPLNNQLTIQAQGGPLTNQEIIVELLIVYDIISYNDTNKN
jgi:hypothetical protein